MKRDKCKLQEWKDRLARADSAYSAETALMDRREELYRGSDAVKALVKGDKKEKTPHVRNICAELIEAQVDSNIPQPKVTARRKKDEHLAKLIEDMLRNELDRLPFEQLNDMMERTVPIQGGGAYLVEWDNSKRTHTTVGELAISTVHPKQLVPQDGVYSGIEDMDYIILKLPQTKGYIERRYGVCVEDESESEPSVKSTDGNASEDMVTQYAAYYRNGKGGIGLYSWVGDTQLEDLEDYQARRLRRCKKCGAVEPMESNPCSEPAYNGMIPELNTVAEAGREHTVAETGNGHTEKLRGGKRNKHRICPYCGSDKWEESEEDYEELSSPVKLSDGSEIPTMTEVMGVSEEIGEMGLPMPETVRQPQRIPFYKPDIFPVILQKNVSVYGKLLGDSDIDKIATHQNVINRLEAKMIDKVCMGGSYISLPPDATLESGPDDMKIIRLRNASDKQMVDVLNMQASIANDMPYSNQIYEEARQGIGITDSFQGRADRTATSGKAKEFSAAQSAGRLESKRVMKDAAFAALFEAMFKFKLAYADEPRPVVSKDIHGEREYKEFNRYDFLERDESGEWVWNDQFIFSCDTTAPLASNREAMWQETRMNLQTGAFGNPQDIKTLILFWTKMELLHYPGAGETKKYLEEELKAQQAAQMQQAAPMAQSGEALSQDGAGAANINEAELFAAVDEKARRDVLNAKMSGM